MLVYSDCAHGVGCEASQESGWDGTPCSGEKSREACPPCIPLGENGGRVSKIFH